MADPHIIHFHRTPGKPTALSIGAHPNDAEMTLVFTGSFTPIVLSAVDARRLLDWLEGYKEAIVRMSERQEEQA